MIYINLRGKTPKSDWCEKARAKAQELELIEDFEGKKSFIRRKSSQKIWKDLKPWLLEISHNKCWYSEAKELISDYDVDHFRPKILAKDLDGNERGGYWWLTFDWKNYRVAGVVCNREHTGYDGEIRGKENYFPIKDGSRAADNPNCDIEDEIIYLFDPTNPNDPLLLTFDESGFPKPSAREGTWDHLRAKESIRLLYLDYPILVDERKKIWTKCTLLINEAQNLMEEETSVSRSAGLKQIFAELRERVSEDAELSATARACLLSSGNMWARSLV